MQAGSPCSDFLNFGNRLAGKDLSPDGHIDRSQKDDHGDSFTSGEMLDLDWRSAIIDEVDSYFRSYSLFCVAIIRLEMFQWNSCVASILFGAYREVEGEYTNENN